MAVAGMSEEPFSSPKNITRDYPKLHKLQSGYYLCSEMGVMGIMKRISVAVKYYDYSRSNWLLFVHWRIEDPHIIYYTW